MKTWLDLNAWLDIITAILLVLVILALLGPRLYHAYTVWRLRGFLTRYKAAADELVRYQQASEALQQRIKADLARIAEIEADLNRIAEETSGGKAYYALPYPPVDDVKFRGSRP